MKRREAGGWLALADIMRLEGWERDTAKRLANELDLGPRDAGVVEPRGKGGGIQLRLRMASDLVSLGRVPEDVEGLFSEVHAAPLADVRVQPVRELRFAVALADALRVGRLVDPDGGADERTLLLTPL